MHSLDTYRKLNQKAAEEQTKQAPAQPVEQPKK